MRKSHDFASTSRPVLRSVRNCSTQAGTSRQIRKPDNPRKLETERPKDVNQSIMESFNYRLNNQAPLIVIKEMSHGFKKVVEDCLLSRYGTVGMKLS